MTTKTQPTHTPAPWFASSNSAGDDGYSVAYPYTDIHGIICYGIKNKFNANLIAAAPELLEALESLLPMWSSGIDEPWVKKARQAIAKARG